MLNKGKGAKGGILGEGKFNPSVLVHAAAGISFLSGLLGLVFLRSLGIPSLIVLLIVLPCVIFAHGKIIDAMKALQQYMDQLPKGQG